MNVTQKPSENSSNFNVGDEVIVTATPELIASIREKHLREHVEMWMGVKCVITKHAELFWDPGLKCAVIKPLSDSRVRYGGMYMPFAALKKIKSSRVKPFNRVTNVK